MIVPVSSRDLNVINLTIMWKNLNMKIEKIWKVTNKVGLLFNNKVLNFNSNLSLPFERTQVTHKTHQSVFVSASALADISDEEFTSPCQYNFHFFHLLSMF